MHPGVTLSTQWWIPVVIESWCEFNGLFLWLAAQETSYSLGFFILKPIKALAGAAIFVDKSTAFKDEWKHLFMTLTPQKGVYGGLNQYFAERR